MLLSLKINKIVFFRISINRQKKWADTFLLGNITKLFTLSSRLSQLNSVFLKSSIQSNVFSVYNYISQELIMAYRWKFSTQPIITTFLIFSNIILSFQRKNPKFRFIYTHQLLKCQQINCFSYRFSILRIFLTKHSKYKFCW